MTDRSNFHFGGVVLQALRSAQAEADQVSRRVLKLQCSTWKGTGTAERVERCDGSSQTARVSVKVWSLWTGDAKIANGGWWRSAVILPSRANHLHALCRSDSRVATCNRYTVIHTSGTLARNPSTLLLSTTDQSCISTIHQQPADSPTAHFRSHLA